MEKLCTDQSCAKFWIGWVVTSLHSKWTSDIHDFIFLFEHTMSTGLLRMLHNSSLTTALRVFWFPGFIQTQNVMWISVDDGARCLYVISHIHDYKHLQLASSNVLVLNIQDCFLFLEPPLGLNKRKCRYLLPTRRWHKQNQTLLSRGVILVGQNHGFAQQVTKSHSAWQPCCKSICHNKPIKLYQEGFRAPAFITLLKSSVRVGRPVAKVVAVSSYFIVILQCFALQGTIPHHSCVCMLRWHPIVLTCVPHYNSLHGFILPTVCLPNILLTSLINCCPM